MSASLAVAVHPLCTLWPASACATSAGVCVAGVMHIGACPFAQLLWMAALRHWSEHRGTTTIAVHLSCAGHGRCLVALRLQAAAWPMGCTPQQTRLRCFAWPCIQRLWILILLMDIESKHSIDDMPTSHSYSTSSHCLLKCHHSGHPLTCFHVAFDVHCVQKRRSCMKAFDLRLIGRTVMCRFAFTRLTSVGTLCRQVP